MSQTAILECPRADAVTAAPRLQNFALIGVAGYIAPRHLKAIRDTGNVLLGTVDPHDAVGVLDSYFPEARFFTEIERFDRFLERQRRQAGREAVEFVTVCSPNYLHDAHVRLALRVGAHAICEKPLVINPWNLDQLQELEQEYERRIYTVLQLRHLPIVRELRESLQRETHRSRREIELTYITRRGRWYHHSWKGSEEKSGGLAMNIGIHFFDLLLWLFGRVERNLVHQNSPSRLSGCLELEYARVRWFLSVDGDDLPRTVREQGGYAHRSITIDGQELDLSAGFTDLHTEVYRQILSGRGFGIADARPSIELVYQVRQSRESAANGLAHPMVRR